MHFNVSEWLNLVLRWMHIFAGILWIGQTWFFAWMDRNLAAVGDAAAEAGKDKLWMVHSGGFYVVEKQKTPQLMPRTLHWFKWEAAFTWLTGMSLFTLVYYMGGLMVDESVYEMSEGAAIGLSVGLLMVGWTVYDLMVQSKLGKSNAMLGAVSFLLLAGLIFGLTHVYSGRMAYMQVGAMFGTNMVANVWMRILPAQRRMVAALTAGQPVDATLGERAKLRSTHNTYMVVPLVFIMISNHFATATYGNTNNAAVLCGLILTGWAAAGVLKKF